MEAAVDRLEVKVIQAEGLRGTESGPPSAYAEVRITSIALFCLVHLPCFSALFCFVLLCSALFFFMNKRSSMLQ
jgi:hypothetical protein